MSDQLRNKIQQWEASPPENAWANIAVALQEVNAEARLAHRLQEHEESPPPAIMAIVLDQLQPKEKPQMPQAPVIPLQPLYPYLFRYGAAAALIGIIAWVFVGNPFWKNVQQDNAATLANQAGAAPVPTTEPAPSIATAITGNAGTNKETTPPEDQIVSNDLPARDPKYAVVRHTHIPAKATGAFTHSPTLSQAPALSQQLLPVQDRNLRYITIYSENGAPIRLSAKFAPLYYAMYHPDDNSAPRIAENLLQQMQQQMSRRPFIPDPNNHFDMIMLVDLLQQEQ
ncbi:hypothetical protein [Flavihumibacter fluvii]|uniref:hypothetical protein n=1 Tax=Flavihumibacter fluvii TaxID=2838157 RepID=UPI001BDF1736|nr:hypothetical protein [Flavihumibacter fluvii]ULQ54551.1 hypothetical protein KJS93_09485 [Flavihumibacter fluvii]